MKKFLFVWCFFLIAVKVSAQQFSLYNTGSIYDSFENPAERAFIPDTTRQFAFNFFIPNFDANMYVTGNGQNALRTRAFSNYYNTANLKTGQGDLNHLNENASAYTIMFKMFASRDGNQEIGFFTKTTTELRGLVTDESIALFNGFTNFPDNNYTNIFNDNYTYQIYNQVGVTYREQVTKRLAFGIKLSALSGVKYDQVKINQSGITFDKPDDQAFLTLSGTSRSSGDLRSTTIPDKLGYGFQNPGAAISLGVSYTDEEGYHTQYNLKNVGFIHWSKKSALSETYNNIADTITGLSTSDREKNIENGESNITSSAQKKTGFTTPTNGLLEVSVNKSYWIDDERQFRFSPTLIASKELFYSGFTAALVTPVEYKKYTLGFTSSYNDMKLFNFGAQFLIKAPNSDFFIGSERLFQTGSLAASAIKNSKSTDQAQFTTSPSAFTGIDFYIGVTFRFGSTIESRMNESSIPNGDKGFIGKIWENLFHKDKNY